MKRPSTLPPVEGAGDEPELLGAGAAWDGGWTGDPVGPPGACGTEGFGAGLSGPEEPGFEGGTTTTAPVVGWGWGADGVAAGCVGLLTGVLVAAGVVAVAAGAVVVVAGTEVAVGGTDVAVGGTGVFVGGTGVLVAVLTGELVAGAPPFTERVPELLPTAVSWPSEPPLLPLNCWAETVAWVEPDGPAVKFKVKSGQEPLVQPEPSWKPWTRTEPLTLLMVVVTFPPWTQPAPSGAPVAVTTDGLNATVTSNPLRVSPEASVTATGTEIVAPGAALPLPTVTVVPADAPEGAML